MFGAADRVSIAATGGPPALRFQAVSVDSASLSYIDFLLPGIVALSIMISAVIGLATVLVDWRQRGILRRLKLTPIPLAEFFAARITASLVVAIMQVVVLLAFGRFVFGIHISSTWWAGIPVAIAGCLCFLAMGFAIGSMVSNPETGDAVSNVITNPMMFLSGVFFPVAAMPAFVQAIARVLPLYYLANGLRDTTVRGLSSRMWRATSGYSWPRRRCWRRSRFARSAGSRARNVERGRGPMRYQNVIVGGGLAGGMVAQEYREQGGDGSDARDRPRGARPVPPPAAHEGVPPRREAGSRRSTCTRRSGGRTTTSRCGRG